MRIGVVSLALGVALSGCTAALSGGVGGIAGQATGIVGQVDSTINELILQKYQSLHNLRAGMDAIDASSGPVIMTTPAPVITPVPPTPPSPPSPPAPPIVVPPPVSPPGSPIVTPNARLRQRPQAKSTWPAFDFSQSKFCFDSAGLAVPIKDCPFARLARAQ